eukprot:438817_1
MSILLCLQIICIIVFGKTRIARMHLKCDGKGTLTFGGNSYPMVGMKGFPYKKEVMLWPKNTYKKKLSKQYGVYMHYAVGPIHWKRGAYIHSGSMSYSVGCPHLKHSNAIKFYNFVKKSDRVRLLATLDYNDPKKCPTKPKSKPSPKRTPRASNSQPNNGGGNSWMSWLRRQTPWNSWWSSAYEDGYNEYVYDFNSNDEDMNEQNVDIYQTNNEDFNLMLGLSSITVVILVLGFFCLLGAMCGALMGFCVFGSSKKRSNEYAQVAH